MTDVVEEDRASVATRLRRVRCIHCHMPAGGSQPTCWSCGLDPMGPVGAGGPSAAAAGSRNSLPPPWHSALLGTAAAVLVLVALLGTVLMLDPREEGRGVRGIHDRLNRQSWVRADVGGASADFPSRPVRASVGSEAGLAAGEALVATAPGLRVELRAIPVEGRPSPAALVEAYGAATGHQVRRSATASVPGALDALLEGPQGSTRVRVLVTDPTAFLLAVAGPAAAFDRVAASFTLAA